MTGTPYHNEPGYEEGGSEHDPVEIRVTM